MTTEAIGSSMRSIAINTYISWITKMLNTIVKDTLYVSGGALFGSHSTTSCIVHVYDAHCGVEFNIQFFIVWILFNHTAAPYSAVE